MSIKIPEECSPREFLEALAQDLDDMKVSAFAIVISYESTMRADETFVGVKANEKQRLVQLLPLLTQVRERARVEAGLGPMTLVIRPTSKRS